MSAPAALDDRVGTLRLQSPTDDSALAATRSSAVRSVAMPRRGRQILVIRSLLVSPRADESAQLQRDLADEVDRAWRRAQPPGRAAGADAVVFRDRVELLALLLSDLAGDRLAHRWWWAVVGGQIAPRGTSVADVLAEHPREVPAIVAELDRSARLHAVISRLDDDGALRVITAVAAAFSLPSESRYVAAAATATDPVTRGPARPAAMRPTSAQRALVQLALQLVSDPSAARSTAVSGLESDGMAADAIAATADLAPAHVADEGSHDQMPGQPGDRRARLSGADVGRGPHTGGDGVERPGPAAPADTVGLGGGYVAPPTLPTIAGAPMSAEAGVAADTDDSAPATSHRRPSEAAEAADTTDVEGPAHQVGAAESASTTLTSGVEVATGLGGAFFLIAPLLELRTAEAFGERFASTVGWWGSLELLARSLAPVVPGVDREPLWDVLASLNGGRSALDRVRTLRHGDLRRPTGWPPPAVDAKGLPPMQRTAASGLNGSARDWLEHARGGFVAHVCARLEVEADSLVDGVLRRRARIIVDRMHVDVVFPLDAAQLAVRRSGFDRDPGWVPELGRVVLFHFGGRDTDRAWSS